MTVAGQENLSEGVKSSGRGFTIALVGNPNVGKTSVFNRLTNSRAKTSNFSGTTIEKRIGWIEATGQRIVDLPGMFSLDASSPEERVAKSFLQAERDDVPDAVLVVVDATNLSRSLFVAGQTIDLGRPTVVAVNMVDLADQQKLEIDFEKLEAKLRCRVVPVSARSGRGFPELTDVLKGLEQADSLSILADPLCDSCNTCPYAHGHGWASNLANEISRPHVYDNRYTDQLDKVLTHPWMGPMVFLATMLLVFAAVFWLATFPMDWIDGVFGALAETVATWLPEGDLSSLIADGVIGGVGSVVIFLPQICILFFALALLEDSGYLARAVVVADRWMRKVGLPGQAFVPLLTAHACAIPAIMSSRVIENRRDRLAAILVIPLMTCSARLPVYAMVAALLFPQQPWYGAMVFVGAYLLGMVMAFLVAWALKISLLKGEPSFLILDLPPYRRPSLRSAALQMYRRGMIFLRDAGTVILAISIAIWALSTYPKLPAEKLAQLQTDDGIQLVELDAAQQASWRQRKAQEFSFIGRAGKAIEPVFRPLGFDWRTSVGVLTSFAAREVVVSTLSVLYGLGEDTEDTGSLQAKLAAARRPDGRRVFDTPTCMSLLVFFVLAMQCLPTQAVTKKETGSWGWAVFQFCYMSILAYVTALFAYQLTSFFLVG